MRTGIKTFLRASQEIPSNLAFCKEICLEPGSSEFSYTAENLEKLAGCTYKRTFAKPFGPKKLIEKNTAASKPKINKPRVIHLISNIEVGGSQKIVFDLINGLPNYPMDIIDLAARFYFDGEQRTFVSFNTPRELLRLIKEKSLIHLHYYGDVYDMHRYLKVLLKHSPNNVGWIENVNNPLQAYRHQRIKKYVYVSQYARRLQKKRQAGEIIIYPGLDLKVFPLPIRKKSWLNAINLGFVYRLTNDKVDKNTINWLIEIVKKYPKKTLVHIVGDGENFSYYVQRTRQEKVRNKFIFYGAVPYQDIPKIYDRFDFFLAPVHTESYGVVTPYAMAKEIPVIATRIGALPEILGKFGSLGKSRRQFVNETIRNMTNLKFAKKRMYGARKRVAKFFSLSAMLKAYQRVYDNIGRSSLN